MKKKVIWIDEDFNQWEPETELIQEHGYLVEHKLSAPEAFNSISLDDHESIKLIIVDVMLKRGVLSEQFSAERTQNGNITGVILAEDISNEINKQYSNRILFYSKAFDTNILASIEAARKKYGFHYLKKSRDMVNTAFVEKLITLGLL